VKAPPADFTLDELLDFLREDQEAEGYYTSAEWGERLGLSPYKINKLLKMAKARGCLLVTRSPRERLDGSMFPTAVYAFELGRENEKVMSG
jgi:hypothetical protein